jgi:hypothetical protein
MRAHVGLEHPPLAHERGGERAESHAHVAAEAVLPDRPQLGLEARYLSHADAMSDSG